MELETCCKASFLGESKETSYTFIPSIFPLDLEFKHTPTFFLKVKSGKLEL